MRRRATVKNNDKKGVENDETGHMNTKAVMEEGKVTYRDR